ncbi:MAG: tetratricopeptide repeat protein [Bacteroidetes bacterium]|jgi:serine/threonine-protein kinase|nr:tetratricopeptide repeat protein [Bacteroidota bacterium]
MTPTEWRRVKTLLDDALNRPAAERADFLDVACADTPTLRAEVESLLVAHEQAEAVHALESPFATATGDEDASGGDQQIEGQRVGPYRLVRMVGRGGMGSVYLAERADGHYEQTVALKLIRRGLDTDDILSRFAFERQILAGLDHPSIARLYDGGVTDDGRPYFAMEYVAGIPITDYCDQHRLSTPQRLALFRTVCRAVQHAHQNLVVHRDLKPSNILVTDDGQVKLLDFGIAKLLTDEGLSAGPTIPRTRTGARVLTPEYAAPEQVRGTTVTTATDVYQLGVLLYELLTGRRPYRLPSLVQAEIARVILEEEPTRPSTAVGQTSETGTDEAPRTLTPEMVSQARSTDPGRLRRRLAGDLDMICLTALRKEPERRYANVEALAEDVRRHLVGLPVTARPDTFSYRASRFVRRHRTGVAAAAAVALALVVGLGVAVWQGQQAAAERDRAEAEAEKVAAVNQFLVNLFGAADPREEGREVRVASLLDQAAGDLDSSFADQPDVEATLRHTLGVTYRELGLFDESEAQFQRALALRERLFDSHHQDVLTTQNALGNLYILSGDYAQADSILTRAVASARTLTGEQDLLVSDLMSTLGYVHYVTGDLEASLEMHRASVDLREQQPNADEIEIAASLGNVAIVLADLGRIDEAVPLLERQVAIYRRVLEADNTRIGRALTNLASVYRDAGRYDAAVEAFTEAIAIFREALGEESFEIGGALGGLGAALIELGRHAEAEEVLRRSLRIYEQAFGAEHPRTGYALLRLGGALQRRGAYAEAETYLRRALQVWRDGLPEDHPALGRGLMELGALLHEQKRAAEAEPLLREALAVREAALPADHPDRAETQSLLGDCLAALGRTAEAEALLRQGYEGLLSDRGPDHQKTIEARERLRAFYAATGQPDRAAALAEGS